MRAGLTLHTLVTLCNPIKSHSDLERFHQHLILPTILINIITNLFVNWFSLGFSSPPVLISVLDLTLVLTQSYSYIMTSLKSAQTGGDPALLYYIILYIQASPTFKITNYETIALWLRMPEHISLNQSCIFYIIHIFNINYVLKLFLMGIFQFLVIRQVIAKYFCIFLTWPLADIFNARFC